MVEQIVALRTYLPLAAAGLALTKAMSKEWGRYKVCVNCVAFGFINTRLTASYEDPASRIVIDGRVVQAGVPETLRESLPSAIPLGRCGTPEEAAGGVYIFCSPESDYISGEVLLVAGGLNF